MKRILSILLSLALLLALFGCGSQPPAEPETVVITTTEPEVTTEPEPAVFSLKKLPEIGSFVSDEKKAFFYEDGPLDSFEPGDYGEIMPYPSQTEVYREVPFYTYEEDGKSVTYPVESRSLSYMTSNGIMTSDGKIITKPLYEYCERFESDTGKVVWKFNIGNPDEMFSYTPVMIAGDGSWALEFPMETNIQWYSDGNGYFTSVPLEETSEDHQMLYNFDGKAICDLDDLEAKLATDGLEAVFRYYDGEKLMFTLQKPQSDNEYGLDYDDDDSFEEERSAEGRCIFTNSKGKKLSEIQLALPFNERFGDYFIGYDSWTDSIQLFSPDGTPLTQKIEGYFYSSEASGTALLFNRDTEKITVYDTSGKQVGNPYSMDWDFLVYSDNGEVFLDRTEKKVYRSSDGSEIDLGLSSEISLIDTVYESTDPYTSGNLYLMVQTEDLDFYIFDLSGNRIAKIHAPRIERNDYDHTTYSSDLYLTKAFILSISSKGGWYLFDRAAQKERKLPISGIKFGKNEAKKEYVYMLLHGSLAEVIHTYDDDDLGEDSRYELYDLRTGRLLYTDTIAIEEFCGYILVCTKGESLVQDPDGNVILKLTSNVLI